MKPPEAGRVAKIVGDHDRRIEGLEVEDKHWTAVEAALRFENERHAFCSILTPDLRYSLALRLTTKLALPDSRLREKAMAA